MITRAANGIWEIIIPAPIPYSDSERLVGYARYMEGCIEVRASHMVAITDRGRIILPISEDRAIRANMARALLWHLMNEVLVATTETGLAKSEYIPPDTLQFDPVSLSPVHFEEEEEDEAEI